METEETVEGSTHTRSGKRLRNCDNSNGNDTESLLSPTSALNDVTTTTSVEELLPLSKELELEIAHAIFDIGLKVSSPKVLLTLMPELESLSTEHIKSHLQKYRMHHNRNNQEFNDFFDAFISINNFLGNSIVGTVGAVGNSDSPAVTGVTNNSVLSRSTSTNRLDEFSDSGSKYTQRKRSMQRLNEQAEELINEWQLLHDRAILEILKNVPNKDI